MLGLSSATALAAIVVHAIAAANVFFMSMLGLV